MDLSSLPRPLGMMEEIEINLRYPRGAIKSARVLFDFAEDLEEAGENGFRAWIYMGKAPAILV